MLQLLAATMPLANVGSLFGFAPCLCIPFFGLFGLAMTAFWIWMIIEVATKEPAEEPNKIMWLLIVILVHGLGALIYFLARRPERIRKYGR